MQTLIFFNRKKDIVLVDQMSCEERHQDNLNIFEYYLNFICTVPQSKNTTPKDDDIQAIPRLFPRVIDTRCIHTISLQKFPWDKMLLWVGNL